MKDFYDLFIIELKGIYSGEKQIVNALPKMIKAATSTKLKHALQDHLNETKEQVKRLEEISKELNQDLSGFECSIMKSLLESGDKLAHTQFDNATKDSAIISSAQQVEHYEIAVYGTLKAYAKHLKLDHIVELLATTAKEEGHANKVLNEIAEGTLLNSGLSDKAVKRKVA